MTLGDFELPSMDINNSLLDLVEDDFTATEHQAMDTELSQFSTLTPGDAVQGTTLLLNIIKQLGERANIGYQSIHACWRLIGEEPRLLDVLVEGSQRKSFNLVRRLKVIRKGEYPSIISGDSNNREPMPRSEPSFEPRGNYMPQSTSAARLAWTCGYCGDYHKLLLENINAMDRSGSHANGTALIQSSGCGKSRMVDEMAKLVFTIPLNVRDPDEGIQGAYPPSDSVVWTYLCETEMDNVDHGLCLSSLFFKHLFSQVANEFDLFFSGRERKMLPGELASEWRKHLSLYDIHRHRLYERVIKACKQDSPEILHEESIRLNINRLLAALGQICDFPPSNDVKIVLYFDEAHELSERSTNLGQNNRYDIVWSTLRCFESVYVFTLFLSTELSLMATLPPHCSGSSRQSETTQLFSPITEIPFDCHPLLPIRPTEYYLANLSELESLTQFGRTLFWTMLINSKGHDCTELLDDMMLLACRKLRRYNKIDEVPEYASTPMCAILDVLVTLYYDMRREAARQREIEMVGSHMRVVFSVPKDRSHIHSGYPSEPFLAEAASRQMYRYIKKNRYFSMAGVLNDNLEQGLVDIGEKGEVVMRLLLRKAYMDAIVDEQGCTSPNFSKGCSVIHFLEVLFAEEFHGSVLGSRPANRVASFISLKEAFKDAVIRFTHFVEAADSSTVTARGMLMAFLRGSAIMGHNGRQGIDIAIPILLAKDELVEEVRLSALLVQVRRRKQAGTINACLLDAEKLGFFREAFTKDSRPYITLVAELGVKVPPSSRSNLDVARSSMSASAHTVSQSLEEHPRYSIRSYGCTDKTWKVIHDHELAYYGQMLSSDDLLTDHPSQKQSSLQAVRQLLPFWYRDPIWFMDGQPQPSFEPCRAVEVDEYSVSGLVPEVEEPCMSGK